MLCPICLLYERPQGQPYRSAGASAGRRVELLESSVHQEGPLHTCPSCNGMFLSTELLQSIESNARRRGDLPEWDELLRRAYQNGQPREREHELACPACGGEMVERPWGMNSLVLVDVCIECRGVWLEVGELGELGGKEGAASASEAS